MTVNLVDEAYTIIKKKIFDFDLYPGQIASDYTLSKELSMSRTPIRQALQRLRTEGLLNDSPAGKNTFAVAEITVDEIADLFDFREGIETTALELAWSKGIDGLQITQLQDTVNTMNATYNTNKIKEHFFQDQKFHNQLIALSKNKRLIKTHDELLLQLTRMRFLSYLERSLQNKANTDHQNILEAIKDNKREESIELLRHHIITSKDNYCALISNTVPVESFGTLRYLMKTGDNM